MSPLWDAAPNAPKIHSSRRGRSATYWNISSSDSSPGHSWPFFLPFAPNDSASSSSFWGQGALQICTGQLENNLAPKGGGEAGTTMSKQPRQDQGAKISPIVSWHWTFPLILALSEASENEAETCLFLPMEGMQISRAGLPRCLSNPIDSQVLKVK